MKKDTAVAAEKGNLQPGREVVRPSALARAAEAVRQDAAVEPEKYASDAVVPKGGE